MHGLGSALLVLAFLGGASAQQPPPTPAAVPCAVPADDRTVDDYIAELNKQKRRGRNRNPLPDQVCVFGWCVGGGHRPAPPAEPAPAPGAPAEPSEEYSTSRQQSAELQPPCALTPYDPIRAAEHVEVGDLYFRRDNYRGALSRFQEALEHKPGDPVIHLRLGRTLEKMEQAGEAYAHYEASLAAPRDGPWKKEAQAAMERLKRLRPGAEARRD